MQRNITITLAPADAVANSIALSQAPGGAGNLTLAGAAMSGGNVTFDIPRRVAIKSSGDETGETFTVTGVDRYGNVQSETLAGPGAAATVNTLKDYGNGPLTVSISAASAGNITVGTSQTVSTQWLVIDRYDSNGIGFQIAKLAGTFTGAVEVTAEEPFPITQGGGNVNPAPVPYLHPVAVTNFNAVNADAYGSINNITAIRFTLSTFSTGGQQKFSVAPVSVGDA